MRLRVPIEVSSRSGVATPGAIGVVFLKVWAWVEAVVARFAPRAAKARAVRIRIDVFISTEPGAEMGKILADPGLIQIAIAG